MYSKRLKEGQAIIMNDHIVVYIVKADKKTVHLHIDSNKEKIKVDNLNVHNLSITER